MISNPLRAWTKIRSHSHFRILFRQTNTFLETSSQDIAAQELLDHMYTIIRQQRFEDIVVIKTKNNANPRFMILANAFNPRHLISGTEMVNKQYKLVIKRPEDDFAKLSLSPNWNVIDLNAIVVHLFSRQCRAQFDIDQLWAVGSEYDDLTNGRLNTPG